MKIKRASDDSQNMAQSGDSILRSLQNTALLPPDLIVRESSDARFIFIIFLLLVILRH